MITAPNTYKVNRDAIKFLSKMLRKPLASSINAWAALNEFSALLNEQIKLVEKRIRNLKENKQDLPEFASGLKRNALRTGDLFDSERLPIIARRVRNSKRYLARMKAMLVNTNRKLRMLTLMSASHPRASQVSPLGKLKNDLLSEIALLSLS